MELLASSSHMNLSPMGGRGHGMYQLYRTWAALTDSMMKDDQDDGSDELSKSNSQDRGRQSSVCLSEP
jgi:hypothetical protein